MGPRWQIRLDLDPQSASEMAHPETPCGSKALSEDRGVGGGPSSRNLHPSPKIVTTTKASGGDGIPVVLFQILKDDAVKVPANLENSVVATGLEKVSFHSNP